MLTCAESCCNLSKLVLYLGPVEDVKQGLLLSRCVALQCLCVCVY